MWSHPFVCFQSSLNFLNICHQPEKSHSHSIWVHIWYKTENNQFCNPTCCNCTPQYFLPLAKSPSSLWGSACTWQWPLVARRGSPQQSIALCRTGLGPPRTHRLRPDRPDPGSEQQSGGIQTLVQQQQQGEEGGRTREQVGHSSFYTSHSLKCQSSWKPPGSFLWVSNASGTLEQLSRALSCLKGSDSRGSAEATGCRAPPIRSWETVTWLFHPMGRGDYGAGGVTAIKCCTLTDEGAMNVHEVWIL